MVLQPILGAPPVALTIMILGVTGDGGRKQQTRGNDMLVSGSGVKSQHAQSN